MCKFFSCVVTRQADILWHEATDSHEDLVMHFRLNDTKPGNFVRVEFTPDCSTDMGDITKYILHVDEYSTPEWFDAMRDSITERIVAIVKPKIITDECKLLLGGVWILTQTANIQSLKNGRVIVMSGSSRVDKMYGSSRVGVMYDSSRVGVMYDSSQVDKMYGFSQVGVMFGSSRVGVMYGSSQVDRMYDSSQIKTDNRKKT